MTKPEHATIRIRAGFAIRGAAIVALLLSTACGPKEQTPPGAPGAPGAPAGGLNTAIEAWKNDLNAGLQAQQAGNFPEAERLLLSALEKARAIRGQTEIVSDSLYNVGRCYVMQDRMDEAIPYFEESIAGITKIEGENSPRLALPSNDLALVYMRKQQYAKAEPLLVKILALWEKKLGKDHPSTAAALNNLGGLYKQQGRYEEAEQHYRKSMEIKFKRMGRESLDIARGYMNLARLFEAKGDYEKAEPFYREAVSLAEKAKDGGPSHPFTGQIRVTYAAMLNAINRKEDAERLAKNETIQAIFGEAKTWLPDSELTTATLAAVPLTTATLQSVVTRALDYGTTAPAASPKP